MRINVTLTSESSNVVFHYTTLHKLFRILKDNVFEMTSVLGSSSESDHASEYYYLSTTRHRLGAYHLNTTKAGSVLIRLNSTKLRSNLKQRPVNYWGESPNERHRSQFNEAEDRFSGNKPQIKDAKKFMDDVTILFPQGTIPYKQDRVVTRHVIAMCKKAKIPIRIYYDRDAFLADDKSKAMPLTDFFVREEDHRRKKSFIGDYTLSPYIELIFAESVDELSDGAKELYFEYLRYGERSKWEWRDKVREDLNYARLTARHDNPKLRKQLDNFTTHLRKRTWTFKDYVNAMLVKWSSL